MAPRLLWRRSATALGLYTSVILGVLGQVLAARALGPGSYGLLAIAFASAGFFQLLLDLTVEEAVIKYGFRYSAGGDWGRFRTLFARALAFKGAGAVLAGLALAGLAPLADGAFGGEGLQWPFVAAALLPLAQAPEGLSGVALLLHGRYDVRSVYLAFSMGLRCTALAVGSRYGVTEAMAGTVLAQVLATAAVTGVGLVAFRRFPAARAEPLGDDRRAILRFVGLSTLGTAVVSMRTTFVPMLLGLVTSPAQVGFLRAAQAPQTALLALSAPARSILLTEQTRDWERGDRHGVFAGLRRYTVWTAVISAAGLPATLWFMPDLISIAYSDQFRPAADAARLILLAATLQVVFGWTKWLPVSIGRPGLRILTHGVETAAVAPLVLALGGFWGATGAAGAVLASSGIFVLLWAALLVRLRRDLLVPSAAPAVEPERAVVP